VCLHHLPPADRSTGERLGCFVPVEGVDTAGLTPAATCQHVSSGKEAASRGLFP